ncbi:MAG: CvpA family protein [Dethiobacter sp.]|jgi:uncharacterized membrane protein required for colicin V production|nr:MAG: CvpA family protein [Dethiobacter sp.]
MNWLDYALIFILILNLYNGFRHGFLRQVAGLVSLFIAIYAALFWSSDVKTYLQKYLKLDEVITGLARNGEAASWLTETLANIIAFLVVFLVLSLVLGLIARKMSIFNKIPIIGPLNALLGSITGAVKGVLVIFLIVALLSLVETAFWMRTVEASVVVSLSRHYMPLFSGLFLDFVVGKLGKLI